MMSRENIKLFLLCAIVITICFSRLNLNSNFIVLLTAAWLAGGRLKRRFQVLLKDKLFIAYLLYVVIQAIGITMSDDLKPGWKEVESKLGFLAIPVVLCSRGFHTENMRRKVMLVFGMGLTVAALYCISVAIFKYSVSHDTTVFFYHELMRPIDHHAVYFAVFTFINLVFLVSELRHFSWFKKNRVVYVVWVAFYLVLLFLLSSKMVLLITALYLISQLILSIRSAKTAIWPQLLGAFSILLIVVLVLVTDNPVKRRFADLKGNIELLSLNKYNEAMYFNGWQLRLLLWRFTFEIIHEKNAWLTGVGPTNDQAALQQKYLDMGLYKGLESRGDQGYLEFNCHNQFLQSSLQSGVPGLLAFAAWCVILAARTIRKGKTVLTWMVLIIFAFFFIESVFERQYGMVLSTLFPLLYLYAKPVPVNS